MLQYETELEALLERLGKFHSDGRIYLPGTWSPYIFMSDLRQYPLSDDKLAQSLIKPDNDYLKWFKRIHKEERSGSHFSRNVWVIFSRAPLNMYFERTFIELIDVKEPTAEDKALISCFDLLSRNPVSKYDEILQSYGACSLTLFASDPRAYIRLSESYDKGELEKLTDSELLSLSGHILGYRTYPECFIIGPEVTRNELIEMARKC